MLRAFPNRANGRLAISDAKWIDLLNPTEEEIAAVRDQHGLRVPDRRSLEKIEASSRLNAKDDLLTMSAPLISGTNTDHWEVAPVGFVLSPKVLVTVRFAEIESFTTVIKELASTENFVPSAVFTRLIEEVVDRAADHLERGSLAINETSQAVFFKKAKHQRLSRDTAKLSDLMRKIGQVSDRVARVRYAFLSIGRMAEFALERCSPKIDGDIRERLEAVCRDIASLDEFEASLSNRLQFLQDSAVGFISIEQNDVVKVLTVVSVVGVPPVLVVGIYGMNFKYMPELSWRLGYPYALVLCLLSIVVPLLWFKWRDWI
jgi:magnesium transporter